MQEEINGLYPAYFPTYPLYPFLCKIYQINEEYFNFIEIILKELNRLLAILKSIQGIKCFFLNFHHISKSSNNIYFFIEYSENSFAQEISKRVKFSEAELIFLIKCILNALEKIYSNGFCHLDVNSKNIFLNNGIYKIGPPNFFALIMKKIENNKRNEILKEFI